MSFSRRNEEKERKIPANNGDIVNQNLSPNSPIINLKKFLADNLRICIYFLEVKAGVKVLFNYLLNMESKG